MIKLIVFVGFLLLQSSNLGAFVYKYFVLVDLKNDPEWKQPIVLEGDWHTGIALPNQQQCPINAAQRKALGQSLRDDENVAIIENRSDAKDAFIKNANWFRRQLFYRAIKQNAEWFDRVVYPAQDFICFDGENVHLADQDSVMWDEHEKPLFGGNYVNSEFRTHQAYAEYRMICKNLEQEAAELGCEDSCQDIFKEYRNGIESDLFKETDDRSKAMCYKLNNKLMNAKIFIETMKIMRMGKKPIVVAGGNHIDVVKQKFLEAGFTCVESVEHKFNIDEVNEDGVNKVIIYSTPLRPSQIRNVAKWPVLASPQVNVPLSPLFAHPNLLINACLKKVMQHERAIKK